MYCYEYTVANNLEFKSLEQQNNLDLVYGNDKKYILLKI